MSKKIVLTSSDGETFEVDEAVALQCGTLKNMIEDECTGDGIPLVNVNSVTLAKVIEYLKKHVEAPGGDNDAFRSQEDAELKKWDEDFVKVDQALLFDVILAANFLNIPGLLDLTCLTVADMMRGKTLDEIRDIFHIKNDYTELEAAAVIKENEWAFQ